VVTRLDLTAARLVVLSACETGLIDIRQSSPDEFIGLSTAFMQAGAPAVLSTLWRVDDLSTMLLMERFYHVHLFEGMASAAALRAAQLLLRDSTAREMGLVERWRQVYETASDRRLKAIAIHSVKAFELHPERRPFEHPYYWAPFTLVGA
jgi:CHAT domain-containing protein